jgi:hypothetical protein
MNKGDIVDDLFDLKTSFYLGNYQQAVNEAQRLRVTKKNIQHRIESDVE